jgi:hypothetical protein
MNQNLNAFGWVSNAMFFEGSLRQRRLLQRSKLAKLVTSSMHKAYSLEKTTAVLQLLPFFKAYYFQRLSIYSFGQSKAERWFCCGQCQVGCAKSPTCVGMQSCSIQDLAMPCGVYADVGCRGPHVYTVAISSPEISVNLMDLRFIMIIQDIFQASRVNQAESFGATAICHTIRHRHPSLNPTVSKASFHQWMFARGQALEALLCSRGWNMNEQLYTTGSLNSKIIK